MGAIAARGEYCTSSPGLIKWIGIIIASIVLILLLIDVKDAAYLHQGEQYTVVVASLTIAICFLLLLVFFLDLHRGAFHGCRCNVLVGWIFLLLALLWLIAGAVETWYTVEYKGNRVTSNERWLGLHAAAAALSFLNGILFALAMQQSRVVVIYTDI